MSASSLHSSRSLLHFWAPGLFDFKGGIQVFSQFLLAALQDLYPQMQCHTFLMHDCLHEPIDSEQTQFHYCGHFPLKLRTPAFGAQVLASGLWQMPDLVLTTHLNFTVAAYRLKQIARVPYWTIAHGFEAWDIDRPHVLQALSHADRILAVSNYTRDRLLENGRINPERVQILPNTFDASRFRIAQKPTDLLQRYGLSPDQPIILTVNRLAAEESFHSYDQVLHALPLIQKAVPNVHYLIVGKGNDRERLENLIQSKQLQNCVTLAGFVSDEELPNYYNLCDVFAMPSKLEGFGIVYLEAMASGKPVVGGMDGAMDALDQGRLGAILNPDDVPLLAETLIQILQRHYPNPLLYQPHALREKAIQTFGMAAFQHRLAHLMQTSPIVQKTHLLQPT
ncbi:MULTISPECIES: glycosyltransferase [Leptolyngbya]|uniref:glycosyltransferase n=1 Tax=Leptolyngbya TaxID=47251 RepID=UPI00168A01B0|nr:glycosyltransferase [Leptolyngbya sp. FACHB-1624]MBD1855433.1 glycosyltransferase [Leptolyngbya sp. FACHB-1624]